MQPSMDFHVSFLIFTVLPITVHLLYLLHFRMEYLGSDYLTEFALIMVWKTLMYVRYMLDSHNGDPLCVLTGSSTHNERIERLWRDVHRCVVHFADIFS